MKKSRGSIMDFLTIAITILAMAIAIMAYLNITELIMKKMEISQTARRYILKMETEGYLSDGARSELLGELQAIGLSGINLEGTTQASVDYGETILLEIRGEIQGVDLQSGDVWTAGMESRKYEVYERRMSTAKN